MAPEPVTLLNQSLNLTLSGRDGFMSEAAKRRIGISPNGEIPFPPLFKPSADHIAMAAEKGVSIETELLNFRDYHLSRGTQEDRLEFRFQSLIRMPGLTRWLSVVVPSRKRPLEQPRGWEDFL
jgi:hypothetical protein